MFNDQWGPHAWYFLHSITFQYPNNPTENDKKNFYNFFDSLKNILPCPKCRSHYSQNFIKNPIQLNSRLDLIKWFINIHNQVNLQTNKKILSFDDVESIYQWKFNYLITENESIESNQTILLLFIFVLLLYYFLFK